MKGQAGMSLFDLLFLAAALCTVITMVAAVVFAIGGRGRRAIRILRVWAIAAGAYLTVSLAVSFFSPQVLVAIGEPWCFDDWCLTAQRVQRDSTSTANIYQVDLLIHSRAGRVSQRAKGAWLYLVDDKGRRFAPDPNPSAVPLDVLLQPQQSITTTRTFRLPSDARAIGLITGHGGPYCGPMELLVVGQSGCLFHKPMMIRVQ